MKYTVNDEFFKLNDREKEKVSKILEAIDFLYEDHGDIEYRFNNTGIGVAVSIYSKKLDKVFDVTDYGSW